MSSQVPSSAPFYSPAQEPDEDAAQVAEVMTGFANARTGYQVVAGKEPYRPHGLKRRSRSITPPSSDEPEQDENGEPESAAEPSDPESSSSEDDLGSPDLLDYLRDFDIPVGDQIKLLRSVANMLAQQQHIKVQKKFKAKK